MEPSKVDIELLYQHCADWAAWKRQWFPRWDFDDITHEALMVAYKLLPQYDSDRGDWKAYLTTRLWEPLDRKYAMIHGVRIDRKRQEGKWSRRRYVQVEAQLVPFPHPEYVQAEPVEIGRLVVTDIQREQCMLLGRGYSQKQVATILGVSQSAVCASLRNIRSKNV